MRPGRKEEIIAATHLIASGYRGVTLGRGNHGPDVTFESDGVTLSVEVKKAHPNAKVTSWHVGAVYKTRLNDHFVAIVLPNEKVLLFTMAEHLSQCSENGRRAVTNLVKTHCPEFTSQARRFPSDPGMSNARDEILERLRAAGMKAVA